ncbi:unnamed protein product [Kuraishia capsulata CBS 1993]|uniref:C2H2-type domain-containing protein n=1 Tax=Kuraishia capsulata CBS 1993 TaxID=1382522 RepID=W6MRK2_9ASCO|nr:uncharacterized protein KUCA_T00005327001 [Kuraishia capsulata CBS 1993]CDK29339.1 unnamed protein product [Kuraishia capsulata CBS 1993]
MDFPFEHLDYVDPAFDGDRFVISDSEVQLYSGMPESYGAKSQDTYTGMRHDYNQTFGNFNYIAAKDSATLFGNPSSTTLTPMLSNMSQASISSSIFSDNEEDAYMDRPNLQIPDTQDFLELFDDDDDDSYSSFSDTSSAPPEPSFEAEQLQMPEIIITDRGATSKETTRVPRRKISLSMHNSPQSDDYSQDGDADDDCGSDAEFTLSRPKVKRPKPRAVSMSAKNTSRTFPESVFTPECSYDCSVCGKVFSKPYNLRSHKKTHTNLRPFVCSLCGKTFARQHDRKRHEDLHSGEKRFQCTGSLSEDKQGSETAWGCGRRFARTDALRRHLQTESGKRCVQPYVEYVLGTNPTLASAAAAEDHLKPKLFPLDISSEMYSLVLDRIILTQSANMS